MNSCQNNKSDSTRVRKIIPIIIGSLLALAILFGAVLGTVALVREANSVVSYNGITVSRGVASYLASTYKATFISSLRSTGVIVSDAQFFWNKVAEGYEDTTYGDLLRRDGEKYIRGVLVRAYLFDRYSSLDSSAREWIDTNVKEILDYKADGSIKKFNETLSDEYALLIRYHPQVHESGLDLTGAVDLTSYPNVNELILISDILITDYSSICMDFSMLDKPTIFYAYDLEDYTSDRNFYFDYEEYVPGVVVKKEEDLIRVLKQHEYELDRDKNLRFKNFNFDNLDGKASKRVADNILS